jgi:hypothetical protein
MQNKRFNKIKEEILSKAQILNACSFEYSRANSAQTEAELVQVIKDNFQWCVRNGLFDEKILKHWFPNLKQHYIYFNQKKIEVSANKTEKIFVILWGNSQATVKMWNNSQATVKMWNNSQATVEMWNNSQATVEMWNNSQATVKTLGNSQATVTVQNNSLVRDLNRRTLIVPKGFNFQIVTREVKENDTN